MIQRHPEEGSPAPSPEALANLEGAAARALAEAARRRAQSAASLKSEKELEGRGGLEPTRYGDWEVKGLASDF